MKTEMRVFSENERLGESLFLKMSEHAGELYELSSLEIAGDEQGKITHHLGKSSGVSGIRPMMVCTL